MGLRVTQATGARRKKERLNASLQSCLTLGYPMDCSLQAPLSVRFCRLEYWSWMPFPTPADLPDPGIEPTSLASLALAGGFFTASARKREQ